jgi:peptide chain release factor 2
MDKLKKLTYELSDEIKKSLDKINYYSLKAKQKNLTEQSQQTDFWDNSQQAQIVMQELSELQRKVEPWDTILSDSEYLKELIELNDSKIEQDISELIESIKSDMDELRLQTRLSGPYDSNNAIISIYAGAGGTDAQDWTQMLLRMYTRWADKDRAKVTVINESPGEEAGLKSITIEIKGTDIYGRLKGEHGVHRLVRLSPFNSNNLRETSFAKVEILPEINQPEKLEIDPKDLKIDVYRAGGHGGQSVNTTDSAVRITHIPTGINVAIQNERSQAQNKEVAMTIIRSKLVQLQIEQHKDNLSDLKGPNQSAEWGSQIRSYVLHPYKMVKDLRTGFETSDVDSILDGNIDQLIESFIDLE